jgi:hypothetical protein
MPTKGSVKAKVAEAKEARTDPTPLVISPTSADLAEQAEKEAAAKGEKKGSNPLTSEALTPEPTSGETSTLDSNPQDEDEEEADEEEDAEPEAEDK